LPEALMEFEKMRLEQIKWFKNQSLDFWKISLKHEEYDPFNTQLLVRHMMFVDQVHLFQMEKIWLTKEEYL
jgi:hypothetical protein